MTAASKLLIAATLLCAGLLKALDPASFETALKSLPFLPEALAKPVSLWIPTLEILTGLLLGCKTFEGGALTCAMGLFAVFTITYALLLSLGETSPCPCFETNPLLSVEPTAGLLRAGGFFLLTYATWRQSLQTRKRLAQ